MYAVAKERVSSSKIACFDKRIGETDPGKSYYQYHTRTGYPVAHPERWKRAIRACPLRPNEDGLTRPPHGYAADHPLIEDLRRQTFITSTRFTDCPAGNCASG